jgi:hypothetical protein
LRCTDDARDGRENQCHDLSSKEHGKRAVPLLEGHGNIYCYPIEDAGEQHQSHAERSGIRRLHRRPTDDHYAEKSDRDADDRLDRRRPADDRRGGQPGEDGDGPIDHPGQRRIDPLLSDREQKEWCGHPQEAEERHRGEIAAIYLRPRGAKKHQGRGSQCEAQQGDERGGECFERELDPEEG